MKILFMGTPETAAVSLEELLRAGHEIVGVFTRKDKPVGRKQVITPSPVKRIALQNNLKVFQPASLTDETLQEEVRALAADVGVVVAYGRILPKSFLSIPAMGCVNLHFSLLPKYRGAAPVQWAVLNGDTDTGLSVIQMDEGLDTGDILSTCTMEVGANQTSGEMQEIASVLGARLLAQTVVDMAEGKITPVPQQGQPVLAPILDKKMAQMDFSLPAQTLHNLVRGCNPWPLAWFEHQGRRVKILHALYMAELSGKPGEVLLTKPLTIGCAQGALQLEEVVPEGSRAMRGFEWAAGRRLQAGEIL